MPETLATFVAFLLFVTPGLAFELMRERRRGHREYTTFRETAVVVLASVVFSAVSIALLYAARYWQPHWLPAPSRLVDAPGQYLRQETTLLVRALVVAVALATLIAWIWHRILRAVTPDGEVLANSPWYELTIGRGNPQRHRVYAEVTLTDGSAVSGYMHSNEVTPAGELRELVLRSHVDRPLHLKPQGSAPVTFDPSWHYLVIPTDQVRRTALSFIQTPEAVDLRWWQRPVRSVCERAIPQGHGRSTGASDD